MGGNPNQEFGMRSPAGARGLVDFQAAGNKVPLETKHAVGMAAIIAAPFALAAAVPVVAGGLVGGLVGAYGGLGAGLAGAASLAATFVSKAAGVASKTASATKPTTKVVKTFVKGKETTLTIKVPTDSTMAGMTTAEKQAHLANIMAAASKPTSGNISGARGAAAFARFNARNDYHGPRRWSSQL